MEQSHLLCFPRSVMHSLMVFMVSSRAENGTNVLNPWKKLQILVAFPTSLTSSGLSIVQARPER